MDQQRAAIEGYADNTRRTNVAVSDVASRMADVADMVLRSSSSALDVATVATDMQRTSEMLRRAIPDIACKATHADLRDYPRYEVATRAQLEVEGRELAVRVYDISKSGVCIERFRGLASARRWFFVFRACTRSTARSSARPTTASASRFEPQKLKTEEVRRLITVAA